MTEGRDISDQRPMTEHGQSTPSSTEPERRGRQPQAVTRMILIGAAFAALSITSYLVLYFRTGAWQILVDVIGLVVGTACLAPAYRALRQKRFEAAGYWILAGLVIIYGTGELVWGDATLPQTTSIFLLGLLVAGMLRPRRWQVWLATAILYGAYVFLINRFAPLPRYPIMEAVPLTQLINIPLALAALWQAARAFRIGTIRARLLTAFVLMSLLLAAILTVTSAIAGFRSGRDQVIDQLESVATLKEAEIQSWLNNLQTDLVLLINEPQMQRRMSILTQGTDPSEAVYTRVLDRFQKTIESTGRFEELFLMNTTGRVVVSTSPRQENQLYSYRPFFQEGLEGPYVHPPFYSPATRRWSVIVVRPVRDADGELQGVLAGRASLDTLNAIMAERAGLGETGETYVVDVDSTMLTDSRFAEGGIYILTEGANRALQQNVNGAGLYEDYRGEPVIGVYHWLPELRVALLAEQDQNEAFRGIYATLAVNIGVALAAVFAAIGVSLVITRSIANPLAGLAETATQIAAGDLDRTAEVEREDEIGDLANAFNSMTAQLRNFIASLEDRVAERTRELQQRSAYLEASAQVGRAASSILETDRLIEEAVELIRQRFDLYYVGLFLLDEPGQWAILRAGTGEAGRKMLSRGHRIHVGEGMIGWSVAHGEPRVALEAGEDAVRLATAELPETRSEAALPLQSRGQILGALTVQSTQVGAFDPDTLVVLETMADQVAVALDNAQLFAESQAALEAARRAYGEISREAWSELLQARRDFAFVSDDRGVTRRVESEWRPGMKEALQQGQTIQIEDDGRLSLAVPIQVRGRVIGVLDTHKPADSEGWLADEIAMLENLAQDLSVALEAARLYDDAQRRAAREQITSEISTRVRETLDMETVLRSAANEMYEALGLDEVVIRLAGNENT